MKSSQSGNVLFLILIAVALFAALSYVVTQSTRTTGGSASKEKNSLLAAQIIADAGRINSSILRLYISGQYAQVQGNTLVENQSGTVYSGVVTRVGKTIGIFSSTPSGIAFPIYEKSSRASDYVGNENFSWVSRAYRRNGIHIGTPLPDEAIRYVYLNKEVCEEINLKLTGTRDISLYNTVPNTYGRAILSINIDGSTSSSVSTGTGDEDLPSDIGCFASNSGFYHFYMIVKEM